ncbi:MAG: hypothetical protein PHP82_04120, partial [Candidatus ainarchaeum sp.]|nr:hypothetical protein [Candidatus ainarchaeum sp.]
LPYGGIYRIEIEISEFDAGLNSLFDGTTPIKPIKVTIVPVQKAPNYNPFYETPFNGLVGKTGNDYKREDYGISFENEIGEKIKLNNTTQAQTFEGAQTTINTKLISDLQELNNGIVLSYDKNTGNLILTPSQPTPIVMLIDNNRIGDLTINYVLTQGGSEISNITNKKWGLVGSTLGTSKCLDLSNNDKKIFAEEKPGFLSWSNAKVGKNWLATTFFTPKEGTPTQLQPESQQITFYSTQLNHENVMLDHYNQQGNIDYDTLQGIFDRIKNEQMCISRDSEEQVKIWWNTEYLEELINEINPSKSRACN